MRTLADKLVIKIDGDDSGFKKSLSGIGGAAKKGIGVIGRGFAVAGAAGVAAFAATTTAAVKSYSEFEQLSGGAKKIFDEIDYSQIEKDAQEAYRTMGMSANEYLGVMTTVGANFASTLGDAKGYEVAKQGMQAISDFASGTGRSVDELSEKYQMITKSTSSYQSIADQFAGILPATSADFLEQAQAAGFLSESYTKLTDVPMAEYQEAVTQMLSKGVDALGLTNNTAMEASTTLSGSFAMMKASWQNLLTGMADPTQDFDVLLQNFISSLGTFAGNLFPVVQTAAQGVLQMVQGLLPQLSSMIAEMLPMVVEGAAGIVSGIVDVLPQIMNAITGLLPQVLTAFTQTITQISAALPAMIQSFVAALPTIIPTLIDAIVAMMLFLPTAIPQIIQPIIDSLPMIITSISAALIANLPILIQGAIQLVVALVAALPQIIMALLQAMGGIAAQIGQALFTALPGPIQNAFSAAFDTIKVVWDLVSPYFEMVWNNIKAIFSVVGAVLGGFFEVAWTAIQAVWDVVCSYFAAIWDTIAGIFSVVGAVLSGNFSDAWEAIKSIVGSWVAYFQSIWNGIVSVFSAVVSWFGSIFSAAWEAIKSVWNNVTTFFTQVWQNIKNVFSNAVSSMGTIGRNIVEGLGNGISNATSWLIGKIKSLCSNALDAIKSFFGIASPAKKMIPIGEYIVQGIAIGIRLTATTIKDAMNKINETILRSDMERNLAKAKTREEMEKIIDESNLNILENEREYLIQSQLLKDSELEADKERLEILKENADAEKEIYASLNDYIEERKEDYIDSLEDIKDAQKDFADDLKTDLYESFKTNSVVIDGRMVEFDDKVEDIKLTNWDKENKRLARYKDILTGTTDRLKEIFGTDTESFKEILEEIRSDDELLSLLNEASDEALLKWVQGYQENKRLRKDIANDSFADNELAELKKFFEDEFGLLPDTFFALGEESAQNFAEKFIAGIKSCVAQAQNVVTQTMQSMFPTAALAGVAGVGAGNISNTSYSATYVIQAQEGESLLSSINKLKDYETYNKASGGW